MCIVCNGDNSDIVIGSDIVQAQTGKRLWRIDFTMADGKTYNTQSTIHHEEAIRAFEKAARDKGKRVVCRTFQAI